MSEHVLAAHIADRENSGEVVGCKACDWRPAVDDWDAEVEYMTHLADVLRAAGYIHRDEQETSA